MKINVKQRRFTLGAKLIIILSVIITLVLISMIINPLRRPDALLRTHVLRTLPIGTNISDAVYIVENHSQWQSSRRIRGLVHDVGVQLPYHGHRPMLPIFTSAEIGSIGRLIGEQSMVLYLGTYRTAFFGIPSSVEAFVAFDGNSELIEIFILRLLHFP